MRNQKMDMRMYFKFLVIGIVFSVAGLCFFQMELYSAWLAYILMFIGMVYNVYFSIRLLEDPPANFFFK
jgi:hypothetical protein